jgi:hypothetical protein
MSDALLKDPSVTEKKTDVHSDAESIEHGDVEYVPTKSDIESDEEKEKETGAQPVGHWQDFTPDRTFYINRFYLLSSEINIFDLTGKLPPSNYKGGFIADELRNQAREIAKGESKQKTSPAYQLHKAHWWTRGMTLVRGRATGGDSDNTKAAQSELAYWKHPVLSTGTPVLSFPEGSSLSQHDISLVPKNRLRRTTNFVHGDVSYTWECDSKFKSNRLVLYKTVGNKKSIVARYAQRIGNWASGGVLLVEGKEVDEAMAVLSAVVVLTRLQQRTAETAGRGAGGGSGGSG